MKLLVVVLLIDYVIVCVKCCNEATCSSIVSKCLLTKACSCDLSTRVCSKDCFSCLGYLYTECCICVDMCPKVNETNDVLSKKSHVEDFFEPVPELFNVLTEYPDELDRWTIIRYPLEINIGQPQEKKKIKIKSGTDEEPDDPAQPEGVPKCTVVFWSQCMSWTKCKSSCLSMGSISYRWFHDGCCECIGPHCINYGINESRCKLCPLDDEVVVDVDEDELDYGEDDFFDYEEGES